jgi:hypothetical protein
MADSALTSRLARTLSADGTNVAAKKIAPGPKIIALLANTSGSPHW